MQVYPFTMVIYMVYRPYTTSKETSLIVLVYKGYLMGHSRVRKSWSVLSLRTNIHECEKKERKKKKKNNKESPKR